MRKHIVAGNWKMNTTVAEGVELAKAVVAASAEVPADVKLIIAPPFTHLYPVAEVVKGTAVGLSAQNCADHVKGAYTGEVAVNMLSGVGCQYVILGHSERREYYGETDATLVEKVKLALAEGLSPIFCIGEKKEEREAGRHFEVVTAQVKNVLFELTAEEISILYGGSCKPSNAKELFACPDIDGGLIGGAALKAEDFIGIAVSF